jgi:mandelate racemase
VAESAQVAEGWAKRGFRGVKAKIGYPTVQEDIAVIRAMRTAVGPDVAIMVDYNQSLTPSEAIQRLRYLDDEGITWVEEPTLAHDFRGHAQIARAAETPIQCGENWWGPLDVQHALDAQASDLMMLDVMKIGGVTGWMWAAALAHTHGVPISADWWSSVLREPLQIRDGMAVVADTPGTGVAWDEAAVTRFLA